MHYLIVLIVFVMFVAGFASCSCSSTSLGVVKEKVCQIWSSATNKVSKSVSHNADDPKLMALPKATDVTRGEEIVECVAYAAVFFSTHVGGGGESLYPTNAFSMRKYMPPVVAKSIEGCYTAPVEPLGGYICRYSTDAARTNFLCTAYPANGYTGIVFTIRKDMKVHSTHNQTK